MAFLLRASRQYFALLSPKHFVKEKNNNGQETKSSVFSAPRSPLGAKLWNLAGSRPQI